MWSVRAPLRVARLADERQLLGVEAVEEVVG
jgi:hypothetical protein